MGLSLTTRLSQIRNVPAMSSSFNPRNSLGRFEDANTIQRDTMEFSESKGIPNMATSLDNGCHTNPQSLCLSDDQEVGGGPIISFEGSLLFC